MKKLKDLTDVDKINVPKLMTLKGGVVPSVPRGCDTHACHDHSCKSSSCMGNTCNSEACVTLME